MDLFDKIVVPILLCGCELWGFENIDIIERVHLKYCKLILNIKQSTPNFIVYGELGRTPLVVDIKSRMISYWCKLIIGKQHKFCSILYKFLYSKFLDDSEFKWLNFIKSVFEETGLNNIWLSQTFPNDTWLIKCIKQKLYDQFLQSWYEK